MSQVDKPCKAWRKKSPSLSIGLGLRGGRWPGPMVERDGLRCYFGRGWVTDGPQIAGRQRLIGGIAAARGFETIYVYAARFRLVHPTSRFFSRPAVSPRPPAFSPEATVNSPKIERALISV